MRLRMILITCVAFLVSITSRVDAAPPYYMTVQGRLTDAFGVPLPAGNKAFVFRIFPSMNGGAAIWPNAPGGDVQSVYSDSNGVWVAQVGSTTPLTNLPFSSSPRWLEIVVDGTTLPRTVIATSPYSFRVATVDGATGGTISGDVSVSGGKLTVGSGHVSVGLHSIATGQNNAANGDNSSVIGGTSNYATGSGSGALGGIDNSATGPEAVTVGGSSNIASGQFSFVGGGENNKARSYYSAVVGGSSNEADTVSAVVVGGDFNTASGYASAVIGGVEDTATGTGAAVIGGAGNTASGLNAIVAGGNGNLASGDNSFAAGQFDTASGNFSIIGGGSSNIASEQHAVIGGGFNNTASKLHSTVGGGSNNYALGVNSTVCGGDSNVVTSELGLVSGGKRNVASDRLASVLGGYGNIASGDISTVAGGWSNSAEGDGSFAAGMFAHALHSRTFVWNGNASLPGDFSSTGPWQFLVNAYGGVGINLNAPTEALHVSGNIRATACVIGTNIACPSDARFKQNVTTIDHALDAVEKLRGVKYEWKRAEFPDREFPEGEQVGLIAQEVRAVVPQAVQEMGDGYLAVDYARLVPLLIEGMKEQQLTILAQQQRIETLEKKMDRETP
jgi:hypothetical protein